MTLQTQAAVTSGGFTNWAWDDVFGNWVPVSGASPIDLIRGIGDQGQGGRALVNNYLPPGLAFVMSTFGAETNTFTTRVAIGGTFLNAFKLAATQTAGTFPAGALNKVGRTVRITATGNLGTTATPNFTFDFALGAAGANVLATTGSLAINAAATTPAQWMMDVVATVQTAGSSGVITSGGTFCYATATDVTYTWAMGNSTVGTGLTVDLTAALAFNLFATCGTSSASNRVIANTCIVEVLY